MAKVILDTMEVDGEPYNKVQYSEIVLTGPVWLYKMFHGISNTKGTARIIPGRLADGNFFVPLSILDDPDWDHLDNILLPNKQTLRQVLKPVRRTVWEPVNDLVV